MKYFNKTECEDLSTLTPIKPCNNRFPLEVYFLIDKIVEYIPQASIMM